MDLINKYLAEQTPGYEYEYNYEGDMAKTQLNMMMDAASELKSMLDNNTNLPEWVQSKITKAADYVDSARDYMKNMNKDPNGNVRNGPMGEQATSVVDSGWKKTQAQRKDKFGNPVKTSNVARSLARQAMQSAVKDLKKGPEAGKRQVEEVEELGELKRSTIRSYGDKRIRDLEGDKSVDAPFRPKPKSFSNPKRDVISTGLVRAAARLSGVKPTQKEEVELDEAINHLQMAKHHQALAKEHDRISHEAAGDDVDDLSTAHTHQSEDHQDAAKAHLQAHKTGNPKDVAAAKKASKESLNNYTTHLMSSNYSHFYNVTGKGNSAGEEDHKDYNYTKLRSDADAVKKGLKEEVEQIDEISLKDRLAGKTAPVVKSKYNRTKANRPMTGKELERHNRSKQLDFGKMPKPDHAKDYTLKHVSSRDVEGELGDATDHHYHILHKGKKVGEHHFAGYFGHGTTTIHGHHESDTGYIGDTEGLHHYMKTKKGHTNVFGRKEGEQKHTEYVAKHGVKKYPELSEEFDLNEAKYPGFRVRMTSGGPKLPRRGYGYVPQGSEDPRTGLPLGFSPAKDTPKETEPKKTKNEAMQVDGKFKRLNKVREAMRPARKS